jgi:uncharacterized membrane protein YsdA (DUF1294 family)
VNKQAAHYAREGTLLILAFFGGSLGAASAQRMLRHKTQKEPFRSLLKGIVVFHVLLVAPLTIGFRCATLGFV